MHSMDKGLLQYASTIKQEPLARINRQARQSIPSMRYASPTCMYVETEQPSPMLEAIKFSDIYNKLDSYSSLMSVGIFDENTISSYTAVCKDCGKHIGKMNNGDITIY